jgi:hypothetical protein
VAQKNDGSVRCGRPGRRHDAERVESGIINHASASPCLTVVAVSMALNPVVRARGRERSRVVVTKHGYYSAQAKMERLIARQTVRLLREMVREFRGTKMRYVLFTTG